VQLDDDAWQITHFHYDDNDRLIAETSGNGRSLKEYVYAGPHRKAGIGFSAEGESNVSFMHNDHWVRLR